MTKCRAPWMRCTYSCPDNHPAAAAAGVAVLRIPGAEAVAAGSPAGAAAWVAAGNPTGAVGFDFD